MILTDEDKVKIFNAMYDDWTKYIPATFVRKALDLYNQDELADKCGVSVQQVRYAAMTGKIKSGHCMISKTPHWTGQQARAIEKYFSSKGKYKPKGMFSPEEIKEIKRLHASGMSQWAIADEFGCTQGTVSRIVRGRKHG